MKDDPRTLVLEPGALPALRDDGFLHTPSGELPDSRWMEGLHAFGRWSLLPGPLATERFVPPHRRAEFPPGHSLILWGKVHFARAFRDGRPREASRDVQHLAFLAWTSGDSPLMAAGTSLLGIDERAHAEAVRRGLPTDGWAPVDAAGRERMQRLTMATNLLGDANVEVAAWEQALACEPTGLLRCAQLTQSARILLMLRTERETEVSPLVHSLARALEADEGRCDLQLTRAIWRPRPDGSPEQAEVEISRHLEHRLGATMKSAFAPLNVALEHWARFSLESVHERMRSTNVEGEREALDRYLPLPACATPEVGSAAPP